jgi:hypothetical protein
MLPCFCLLDEFCVSGWLVGDYRSSLEVQKESLSSLGTPAEEDRKAALLLYFK